MFEKELIDFGTVESGTTKEVEVKYTGELPFDISQFHTSCGCTKGTYNPETKMVSFVTTFKNKGEFRVRGTYMGKYTVIAKATVV